MLSTIRKAEMRLFKNPRAMLFIVFWLLVLMTYVSFSYGARGPNVRARMALTFSIVDDGTFIIDKYPTQDSSTHQGHAYSNKAPGSSIVAIPFYLIYKLVYWSSGVKSKADIEHALGFINFGANTLPTFFTAILFYLFLLRSQEFTFHERLFATTSFALGTPVFLFATAFFGHCLAMAFLFASFYLVWKLKNPNEYHHPAWVVLSGFCGGFSIITDYVCFFPIVLGFGYFAIKNLFKPVRLALCFLGASMPVAFILIYNNSCFGDPLTFSVSAQVLPSIFKDSVSFGFPSLSACYEILLGTYRGLLWYSPFLAASVIGVYILLKNKDHRQLLFLLLCGIIPSVFYIISIKTWNGGATYMPRYILTTVPFFALLSAYGFKKVKLLSIALVAVSVANMLVSTAVTVEMPRRARNPLFEFVYPSFFEGKFISTHLFSGLGLSKYATIQILLGAWAGFLILLGALDKEKVDT
jgi:hypothetical protein